MRKLFRKFLPHHETVKSHRWLRPFSGWLHHPNLWHLHRRSVAGGVAIGLFCGLIPGPLQMISAALLAILFRVNLPVAAFTTLYTNPFTILPLYVVAYEIGAWISGEHSGNAKVHLSFPKIHWHNWAGALWDWFIAMGKPILFGLPLLAIILSITGYFAVRIAWRLAVMWKWHARKQRRTTQ
ncbi:MAG: DUF2062 domain-containing protein [Nitrosomonadales bacterium]|nr:DUF2062 domain-containing protein [Nitrosomonadales bacterium]